MNLVTVVSPEFLNSAKSLIDSFQKIYPDDKVILCYFGGEIKDDIIFKENIYLIEVPHLCPHAHNPRFYFFKTYALKAAMSFNEPFLYLDSRHILIKKPIEIEKALQEKDRFFIQYSHEDIYKLKVCTTSKCFEKMNCELDKYKESYCYWAAIQAYNPTDFNKAFIEEMLIYMMDPDVAGPSNFIENPEPENPDCLYHRNDQSCLSILIEKYNIHQPFDFNISQKYGDVDTYLRYDSSYKHDKNKLVIRGRNSIKKNENNKDNETLEIESKIQNGNTESARKIIFNILQKNKDDIRTLNNLAVIEILDRNYSEAVHILRHILELDTANKVALDNLSYLQNILQNIINNEMGVSKSV